MTPLRQFRRSRCGIMVGCAAWCLALALPGTEGRSASAQGVAAHAGGTVTEAVGQVIAGRVTSAADGHPIPNATVVLTPEAPRSAPRQGPRANSAESAQTDAEGRYRFPAQTAGRYTLRATAAGYLASFYLEHEGFNSAVVTGAGLPTEDLRFALVPEASLHGRILDETGEPVRATVTLYREQTAGPGELRAEDGEASRFVAAGGTQADDDGNYDFSNLQPGRYYVAAKASPWYAVHQPPQVNEDRMPYRTSIDPALDVAYPLTFYPHATTESGAVPIPLKPGARATANLLMQAEHAVTLTVQLPPSDLSAPNSAPAIPSVFRKVFGTEESAGAQWSGRNGDAVIMTGLAAGQYVVRSYGRRRGPPDDEVPVDLTGGSSTATMSAPQGTATDVQMAVRTATGTALPDPPEISLQRIGGPRGTSPMSADKVEAAVSHFAAVPPGDYRVRVSSDGTPWTVNRLSVNGKVLPSKLLRLGGGTVTAEVVASHYTPELQGVARTADGRVHAGALVVLVPAGADSGEDLYRADQSDLDGGFRFSNVVPGNYLLVALDNAWELNWRESAALMPYLPHALPVTVASSGPRVLSLPDSAVVQQK